MTEYLITRHEGINYPSVVQLEITSFCNATCFFCAHTWSQRPQEHMKPELFKKIIDEIRSWPTSLSMLYVTGLGEPLMHPQWDELYSYAEGLPMAFTTNCSLLTEEKIKHLLSMKFYEIAFSLDTLNPERHQKIRGFSVDKVAPKIQRVFELARQNPTDMRLIVSTTLTHETLMDMEPMYKWLVPQLDGVPNALWHIKQVGAFPDVKAPVQIMPKMDFTKNLKPLLPAHPKVAVICEETSLRPYCTLWFNRVTFLSDGSSVPCCHQAHDHNRTGNAKDMTVLEIFNSPLWKSSQIAFSKQDGEGGWNTVPYCKDCR